MADEAQLARTKRIRRNAKIALTHHTRTIDNALTQERTTAVELEDLIAVFNQKKTALEDAHTDLMLLIPEEELEHEAQQQEEYLTEKNSSKYAAVDKLQALLGTGGPPRGDDDDNNSLRSNVTQYEVKLQRLNLPTFDGIDILNWPPFKDAFVANVHTNERLDPCVKFQYLIEQLEGEAKDVVQGFSLTAQNYKEAWDLLVQRYERIGRIKLSHVSALLYLQAPKQCKGPTYVKSLYSMLNTIQTHVRCLSNLGVNSEDVATVLCPLIISKFPEAVALEWSRCAEDVEGSEADLKFTLDFLLKEIRRLERAGDVRTTMHQNSDPPLKQETTKSSVSVLHTSSNTEVAPQSSTETSKRCPICKKQNHKQWECQKFLSSNVQERRNLVKSCRLCYQCLMPHMIIHCKSPSKCKKCGGKHNTLLCFPKSNTGSYGSRSSASNYPSGQQQQWQSAPPGQQSFQSGPSGYQIQSSQHGYQGQPTPSGYQQALPLPPPPGFSMQPAQSGYLPGVNPPSGYTQGPLQQSQGQSSFKRVQGSGENHHQDTTRPRVALTTVGQYSRDSIIMQTAKVKVRTREGQDISVSLLFDSASDRTYVLSKLVKLTKPHRIGQEMISFSTFGGETATKPTLRSVYDLKLLNSSGSTISLSAVEVPFICEPLKRTRIPQDVLQQFMQLPLADNYGVEEAREIQILVGLDAYWDLMDHTQAIRRDGLVANLTSFGYVLSGKLNGEGSPGQASTLFVRNVSEQELSRFWDLESVGIQSQETAKPSLDRNPVLQRFNDELLYSVERSRYMVGLPWKSEVHCEELSNNYYVAEKRLKNLHIRTLDPDARLKDEYYDTFREYLAEGMAELVPPEEIQTSNPTYYLPHHPVVKKDAMSSRVRPVFDASAKAANGKSLNDLMETGPSLNPDLVAVLIRFRRWPISLSGDVRKAFLQICVNPRDRDAHRFLLLINEDIVHCRFTRVPFGNKSSPFLLNACIRNHLNTFPESETRQDLLSNLYVDNYLSGEDSEEAALQRYTEACEMLKSAGMIFDKWSSNQSSVIQEFQDQQVLTEQKKVLGLKWIPSSFQQDSLGFEGFFGAEDIIPSTKRAVLSIICRIFDPLGLISPYILQAKILFQEIWRLGLSWDTSLPEDMASEFQAWLESGESLKGLHLTRAYFPGLAWRPIEHQVEIHAFGDASERAYGTCLYLRVWTKTGYRVALVMSRTRVAPIKKVSLPRLELLSSLLCARMAEYVRAALGVEGTKITCYTDSTASLWWIKGDPLRFKTFVANRVSEIQTLVPPGQWQHCPGIHNPADIASRGLRGHELAASDIWINGPTWLNQYGSFPHADKVSPQPPLNINKETKTVTCLASASLYTFCDFSRYSLLSKVINIVARVVRFANNCKPHGVKLIGPLSAEERVDAETHLWRILQHEAYGPEIEQIRKGRPLQRISTLGKLYPFLDEKGLLRVQGRLQFSELSYDAKHPIILPRSYVSLLLVRFQHVYLKHAGSETLLTSLRSRFFIVGATKLVKTVIKYCVPCQRHDSRPCNQVAAPLPSDRVRQAPPFSVCGLDYAGPLYCKGSSKKYYILLFTCATTRGIHLELTSSLNLPDFIIAFRKMAARRGVPAVVYSDNARTFVAAATELARVYGIHTPRWKLIVPRSPWWGGWWERLVRSVKSALRKTVGKRSLTRQDMEATLLEVEASINTRPLTKLPADLGDGPLTPTHFLRGQPQDERLEIHDLPDISALQLSEMFASRKEALQKFWDVWRNNYIANLPPSVPNHRQGTELKVGDLVLIRGERPAPRLKWPMGKVTKLLISKDNKVRAVELKTATNLLSRPIQKLHKLEVFDADTNILYSEYSDPNIKSNDNSHNSDTINSKSDIRTDPQGEVHMASNDQEYLTEKEYPTENGDGQLKFNITDSGRVSKPPDRLNYFK